MTIPHFLEIAEKLELESPEKPNILHGSCTPSTTEDLNRLNEEAGIYRLFFDPDIELGKPSDFEFRPEIDQGFAGYEDFWRNSDLQRGFFRDKFKASFFHQWAVLHHDERQIKEPVIDAVFDFLDALIKKGVPHGNSLFFFGKNVVQIICTFKEDRDMAMTRLMREMTEDDLTDIREMAQWLQEEGHSQEKRQILVSVLAAASIDNNYTWNIVGLLADFPRLAKEIRGQYELYMEDFSYDKFVKKLEENSDKFVARINDTLGKILSQVLALPVATTALNVFAKEGNLFGYIALLLYALICLFSLRYQTVVLDHLRKELDDYSASGKIPTALKAQWQTKSGQLRKLFYWQYALAVVMGITIFLCILYVEYHVQFFI